MSLNKDQILNFWLETMDYSPWSRAKNGKKMKLLQIFYDDSYIGPC